MMKLFAVSILLATLTAAIAWEGRGRASGIPTSDALFYAGTLQESGVEVTGTRAFTLRLWDSLTATTNTNKKCETTASATEVTRGRFRIALDASCVSAVRANPDLFIEVQVGATSLGRKKLGAMPYAIEADRASAATGALAEQVVPSGAIMAFDLGACPSGWTAFGSADGRTLIGTAAGLTRGTVVGANSVGLSVDQMPAHSHSAFQAPHNHAPANSVNFITGGMAAPANNAGIQLNSGGFNFERFTTDAQPPITVNATGGGQPFDNRQASLVVTYCRKT